MTIRERIKGRKKVFQRQEVPGTDWGEGVFVRELSPAEVQRWNATLADVKGDELAKGIATIVGMVILCACDADGNALFTDDDAGWLAEEPQSTLKAVFEAAGKFNAMSDADREGLRKNSNGTTPAASPSGSR